MKELLLFLPVCIVSCLVLSALHFDSIDRIVSYAWRNIVQLVIGAAFMGIFIYVMTP